MKLTTLRILVLATTLLVVAAGTCIATFGQTSAPAGSGSHANARL